MNENGKEGDIMKVKIVQKKDEYSMEYNVGDVLEVDSTWYGGVTVLGKTGVPVSIDKDEYVSVTDAGETSVLDTEGEQKTIAENVFQGGLKPKGQGVSTEHFGHLAEIEQEVRGAVRDLLAVAKLGGFDVLGHFDYPKRYLKTEAEEPELFDAILKALLANGGILEINTSPLRKGCDETAPGKEILDLYAKAGGHRLIIGSDAHFAGDIAADFEHGLTMAKGFEIGYFKQRKFQRLTECANEN